jgi:formate dehydrogenase iron-sulfur subunit
MSQAVLVDLVRCTGCRACQVACKAWNDNTAEVTVCLGCYDNPPNLSADTWSIIRFAEVEEGDQLRWAFAKRQCMHCEEPACASVCPVGAFEKLPNGPVVYDDVKCIGCRYCMMACPFRVPKFEWDSAIPLIRKCTFCADRLSQGVEPACVKACPSDALIVGDRGTLIVAAHARIRNRPDKYVDHVYGEHEAGGTSWLYVSPVPFEELGFPTLDDEPYARNSEAAMIATPGAVVGAVGILSGIYWITKRRMMVESEAAGPPSGEEV